MKLPSGDTVGADDDWSMTRAAGRTFWAGSTPGVEPRRQPPGCPFAGSTDPGKVPLSLLQPSLRRPKKELCHFGVRSGRWTATKYALRLEKCARLSVYNVWPSGEITGETLNPGRCDPQVTFGGVAVGAGGQGSELVPNVPRQVGTGLGTSVA